jgi:nicotinate-nucleotide pyrophosphorylase (carboxylating)
VSDSVGSESLTQSELDSVAGLIRRALEEDVGTGDVTSLSTVPPGSGSRARIVAKADGIVAGMQTASDVFTTVDPSVQVIPSCTDGTAVAAGDLVMELAGPSRSLLSTERTALNFLQRLSGIATLTGQHVAKIEGTGATILDTRKTTPGWRILEKQAVVAGGGVNHRIGLWDMVLIKENHIRAAGGITNAVNACRTWIAGNRPSPLKIEVETRNQTEIEEALEVGCDRIMLDNMPPEILRKAVILIRAHTPIVEIEASGNVSLDNVREIAETGVDFISIGALTHSAPALDLSLLFDT